MLNETRVNLKHLLEDIRDSYTSPLEEVILIELIANALDGKASKIEFTIDPAQKFICCTDDGLGMKRQQLKEYHNIASSAKTKGTGIGFAGVGAKLSLLIAEKVITASKSDRGSRCATEWRITNPYRAPWKFIPFSGNIKTPRGTAVSICFSDNQSHLLNKDFVANTIIKHFYPLLDSKINSEILHYFYKKGVDFTVNKEIVAFPSVNDKNEKHWFYVRLGKSRHPIGIGYLAKTDDSENKTNWLEKLFVKNNTDSPLPAGLWISTFGKIIKGGWEWLGIMPKNADQLTGIVEIPALAEILTTNKNDFLSDSSSLQKYYKYRKAIQETVVPILQIMGEKRDQEYQPSEKIIKPINQSIKQVLNSLLGDFPELESLIGARRKAAHGQTAKETGQKEIAIPEQYLSFDKNPNNDDFNSEKERLSIMPGTENPVQKTIVKAAQSGLKVVLGKIKDSPEMILGRIVEDTLTINTGHPAWLKAERKGLEEYHILLTVSLTLSQFLENQKSPQEFLNRFLEAWAENENQ